MHKLISIFLALFIALILLTSCVKNSNEVYNLYFEDDLEWINDKIDFIYSAMQNKNKDSLISVFSSSALASSPKLDADIENMFELLDSDIVDYEKVEAYRTSKDSHQGNTSKVLVYKFYFYTDKEKYYCVIKECVFDNEDSGNIGVATIKITNITNDEHRVSRGISDDDPFGLIINKTEESSISSNEETE